jgi:hypothetical protein
MTKSTAADDALLAKLNKAVAAVNKAEKAHEETHAELVSKSKVVGELLLEAKKHHPKDFEAFLKRVVGLKRSRAYDLMRLAGGRVTDEELRKETRERVRKHRAKKKLPIPARPEPKPVSVTKPDVTESPQTQKTPMPNRITESPEISIEQRRIENSLLEKKAEDRSAHYLAEFTVACRTYLPKITIEADRQKARDLVAELLSKKAEAA